MKNNIITFFQAIVPSLIVLISALIAGISWKATISQQTKSIEVRVTKVEEDIEKLELNNDCQFKEMRLGNDKEHKVILQRIEMLEKSNALVVYKIDQLIDTLKETGK